jgi:hypothetical protein
MLTTAAGKPASFTATQNVTRDSKHLVARKIWLPKLMYDALPWFYVGAGLAAFAATLYISEWFWVLPHYLLFSLGCVHLGLHVYRRRRRSLQDT